MDFSVVATFTGNLAWEYEHYCPCDTLASDAIRAWEEATGETAEPTDPGDSEYSYLAEESGDEFWEGLQDVQVSGILTREQFDKFIDDIGAFAEDCETMGTLGGPLTPWGGIVADISFRCESQYMIECIRVTPLPKRGNECDSEERAEQIWQRLRRAMLAVYA